MKEKTRKLLHSRTVFSQGFLRKDGLIDIVGSIKDTKSYDIPKSNGTILNSGEPLHEMKVTLTINMEMKIINANAETYSAPYKICKEANFKTNGLIGETVGPGWKAKVNTIIGGSNGCTHVRELLVSMATVAYQTIYGEKSRLTREAKQKGIKNPFPNNPSKPTLLNTCYAFDETSEVTKKQWPKYWRRSKPQH